MVTVVLSCSISYNSLGRIIFASAKFSLKFKAYVPRAIFYDNFFYDKFYWLVEMEPYDNFSYDKCTSSKTGIPAFGQAYMSYKKLSYIKLLV